MTLSHNPRLARSYKLVYGLPNKKFYAWLITMKSVFLAFLVISMCWFSISGPAFANQPSVSELTANAGHGDPVAQCELGRLYKGGGQELSQDYNQAEMWFRKSAEQGYAPAETELAIRLMNKNDEEAYQWFQKAADQGEPIAKQALALRHSPIVAYIRGLPEGVRTFIAVGTPLILVLTLCGFVAFIFMRIRKKYFPNWNWARYVWIVFVLVAAKYLWPLMMSQLTVP